jgi:hypothetical protein
MAAYHKLKIKNLERYNISCIFKKIKKIPKSTLNLSGVLEVINLPKDIRVKTSIPKKYAGYFKINKNIKITFLELRDNFIEQIKLNKWHSKNERVLILPAELRKILYISKLEKIDIEYLDKLAMPAG